MHKYDTKNREKSQNLMHLPNWYNFKNNSANFKYDISCFWVSDLEAEELI